MKPVTQTAWTLRGRCKTKSRFSQNHHVFCVFKALKLPPGRTTVMHLVARETLPEPNSHGEHCFFGSFAQ